jgi:ribonuclease J
MVDNVKMTLTMNYLSAPEGTLVSIGELKHLPNNRVVIVTTGSQGEPTSALVRMAKKEQRDVQIVPGDTIIVSASPIPGNETTVSRTIDNLYRLGAKVFYHRNELVHVHGHASQEELKMMLNLTSPKFFVPVHGEYRHLVAHATLAQSLGIPKDHTFVLENGDVLGLTERGGSIVDSVPGGHVYVDGGRVWNMGTDILKERNAIAKDGILLVVLPMDKITRKITGPPKLISRGFVDAVEANGLYPKASQVVFESLKKDGTFPEQKGKLDSIVRNALVKFLYQQTGRSPMIIPVCIDV